MAERGSYKIRKCKTLMNKSLEKNKEALYKKLDNTNIENNKQESVEWKPITDFYPRKKKFRVKEMGQKILASRVARKYAAVIAITLLLFICIVQLRLRPVVVVNVDKTAI